MHACVAWEGTRACMVICMNISQCYVFITTICKLISAIYAQICKIKYKIMNDSNFKYIEKS